MKLQEKFKAIDLRKSGKSYGEILKLINVSKSTISLWLRDIELSPEQKEKLLVGRKKSQYESAQAKIQKRIKLTEQIISESKKEVNNLINDPLFLPGLMLYWAEGAKTNEHVKLSNSDSLMIKFMMKWFRKICKVPEKKFRIALHIHSLHCRKDTEKYWSEITGIPLSQFNKTFVKPTSLRHRTKILYNGTCNIVVFDKNLFRRINGWRLGFLEKYNII